MFCTMRGAHDSFDWADWVEWADLADSSPRRVDRRAGRCRVFCADARAPRGDLPARQRVRGWLAARHVRRLDSRCARRRRARARRTDQTQCSARPALDGLRRAVRDRARLAGSLSLRRASRVPEPVALDGRDLGFVAERLDSSDDRWRFRVTAEDTPTLLWISQQHHADQIARADESATKTTAVAGFLQGMIVPPKPTEVTLEFRPWARWRASRSRICRSK